MVKRGCLVHSGGGSPSYTVGCYQMLSRIGFEKPKHSFNPEDLEFEVALDSGSVVHVCSLDDCRGYRLQESPGSKRGQEFLMGDGGTIPNMGAGSCSSKMVANVPTAAWPCSWMVRSS